MTILWPCQGLPILEIDSWDTVDKTLLKSKYSSLRKAFSSSSTSSPPTTTSTTTTTTTTSTTAAAAAAEDLRKRDRGGGFVQHPPVSQSVSSQSVSSQSVRGGGFGGKKLFLPYWLSQFSDQLITGKQVQRFFYNVHLSVNRDIPENCDMEVKVYT